MTKYDEGDTPRRLTEESGLEEDDRPIGKYVEVKVSDDLMDEEGDLITGTTIWFYYTLEDLDMTGDGDADDPVDLDEETLALYRYDDDDGSWVKLTEELDWVEGVQVSTDDVEMFGMSYAGFIRADISRLSLFSAGGRIASDMVTTADPGGDMTVDVGAEVTFDGSGSEGIGGIARYTWTFAHNWQNVTLRGENPTFTFRSPGEYLVTLTVRDGYGGVASAEFTVTVEPVQVTVLVGPVLDSEATVGFNASAPIHDALVILTWGEQIFEARTDFSGFAYVSLPVGAVGKDVSVHVSADGFEPQEYTTSFDAGGTLDRQPEPLTPSKVSPPPDDDAEGPAGWEWAVVVVAMVLALLALLLFVGRRPRVAMGSRPKGDKEGES